MWPVASSNEAPACLVTIEFAACDGTHVGIELHVSRKWCKEGICIKIMYAHAAHTLRSCLFMGGDLHDCILYSSCFQSPEYKWIVSIRYHSWERAFIMRIWNGPTLLPNFADLRYPTHDHCRKDSSHLTPIYNLSLQRYTLNDRISAMRF